MSTLLETPDILSENPYQIRPLIGRPYFRKRITKEVRDALRTEDMRLAKIRSQMVLHTGRLAHYYKSQNGICLWAFRLESSRLTAARIPDWWLDEHPMQLETLEKMRVRVQGWPSGYTRGNFGVPLFSLEALRMGCCERDIQCSCGSGRYMFVPGRCLACKPVHELAVRQHLWTRLADSIDLRMGREKGTSGGGDSNFCYLVSQLWSDRIERKKESVSARYSNSLERVTAPVLTPSTCSAAPATPVTASTDTPLIIVEI